jgi:hypothetical protein
MSIMQEQYPPAEFIDAKGMRVIFGLSRSHSYALTTEGKIKSASIRKPGSVRGKRLWLVESVRGYLLSCLDEKNSQSNQTF